MRQKFTLITLGVRDFKKALAFYENLGWQKSDGTLWLPNELVTLHAPQLGINKEERLIVDCRYVLDEGGTKTYITLMHRDAFSEPPEALSGKNSKASKKSDKDKVKEFSDFKKE